MQNSNKPVAKALEGLLANTYVLYLKTQNYHWNVTGASFAALHVMFQTQYEELAAANDEIAERIRSLGEKAPGSFSAFVALSEVKEETGAPKADEMLLKLSHDQEILSKSAKNVLETAQKAGDEATADLAIARIQAHDKNHWMLKAHLE